MTWHMKNDPPIYRGNNPPIYQSTWTPFATLLVHMDIICHVTQSRKLPHQRSERNLGPGASGTT
uniref:Uncharacterized protein n=1 Tax=Arundo donax TaxID=35708 RepID=A0A0A9AUQ6_ARUDO